MIDKDNWTDKENLKDKSNYKDRDNYKGNKDKRDKELKDYSNNNKMLED